MCYIAGNTARAQETLQLDAFFSTTTNDLYLIQTHIYHLSKKSPTLKQKKQ